jgi:hypothetical protein
MGAPGINYFANVTAEGALVGGTAISSTRTQPGWYVVKFPVDVSACAAVASSGITGDIGTFGLTSLATIVGNLNYADDEVNVQSEGGTDTAFHLIVVC